MKLEKEIILQLIDKYEKSKSFSANSQRRVILKSSDIKGYNKSYDRKHQVHDAIKLLIEQNFISIDWQLYEENNILEKVYLNIDKLNEIYKTYDYESKHARLEKAKADISNLKKSQQHFILPMIKEIISCLENHKFHKFWPDDQAIRKDIEKMILSLDELDEITERMYSLKYFGDSKHFEKKMRNKLVSILKSYADTSIDEENILESYGIVKNPNELLIKGNIQIDIGHILDLSIYTFGTSINRETIKHIRSVKVVANKIITIENKAVYYEYIKTASDDELVIYLGGFFGKSTRLFLGKLNEAVDHEELLHWSDIDLGGFRIFDYLSQFIAVSPYRMSVDELKSKRDYTQSFNESYCKKLQEYIKLNPNTIFEDVVNYMISHSVRLEQEAFYI